MGTRATAIVVMACALLGSPACGTAAGGPSTPLVRERVDASGAPVTTGAPAAEAAAPARPDPAPEPAPPPTPPPVETPPPLAEAPPVAPPVVRAVGTPTWGQPFATVSGVVLVHPAAVVERVGFHESNHDGARTFEVAPSAVAPLSLESRHRDTAPNSAADVVVDPTGEIRSPVTGEVARAGGYTLYCRYRDDFVVIRPDAAPELEVKLLHISGVQVRAGQRVEAGVTVLAPRPTQLPFDSQVDETTADPAWPHVHIEVVDPTVKDRPTPGGGC
ncbi:MAG TPA: hypothetical protein VM933_01355 [Acidimicrobiales bacterium]|nr:hypothetical protein [Acidimicrobiales bacterium]